jgi:hypothetical protein
LRSTRTDHCGLNAEFAYMDLNSKTSNFELPAEGQPYCDVTLKVKVRRPSTYPKYFDLSEEFKIQVERFISDMADQKISQIDVCEDDLVGVITLAGVHRIVVDKVTKQISTFELELDGTGFKSLDINFQIFGRIQDWLYPVIAALIYRLEHYIKDFKQQAQAPVVVTTLVERKPTSRKRLATPVQVHQQKQLTLQHYSNVCNYIVRQRLSKSRSKLVAAIFSRNLWRWLDRDAAKITMACFGIGNSSVKEYHKVLAQPNLRQIQSETPNLLPLVGKFLEKGNVPLDSISRIKKQLLSNGISEAGWRYLAASPAGVVSSYVRSSGYQKDFSMLNTLAFTQRRPPYTLDVRLARNSERWNLNLRVEEPRPHWVRFLRLAIDAANAAKKRGRLKQFITNDFEFARDWFTHIMCIDKNATWQSIIRAEQQWHADFEAREAAQTHREALAYEASLKSTWDNLLGEFELEDCDIRELSSGVELVKEGAEMAHCVESYISDCVRKQCVIFALVSRSTQERATLELTKKTAKLWTVSQVRGVRNCPVSKLLTKVAGLVAKRYSLAHAK